MRTLDWLRPTLAFKVIHRPNMSSCSYNRRLNPLMALVDVASSILTAELEAATKLQDQENSSLGSLARRSSTPPPITTSILVPSVSPTSSVTTTNTEVPPSSEAPPSSTTETNDRPTFTTQLMALLDDDDFECLTWMPDGKAFTIIKPKLFTKEYMPKYFNIRNMSSFVRKLSRWGFIRVHEAATRNSDIFKHPQFQRGNREKLREGVQQQTTTTTAVAGGSKRMNSIVVKSSSSPNAALGPISTNHPPKPLLPPPSTINAMPTMATVPMKVKPALPLRPLYLPQTVALHRYFMEQQQHYQSWLRARSMAGAASGFSMYHQKVQKGSTTASSGSSPLQRN